MKNKMIYMGPRFLWFLTLSYCMVMVLANWFDARLINVFGLVTDAGTLIFPLTFLLSDLITEVYGYKHARRAIWCGFLFNAVFILYGQLIIHLPGPNFANHNGLFKTLLDFDFRIIVASTLSYLMAEPLNSFVMAKLKIKMQGRQMGLRFISSTFFAAGLDSTIFCFVAFYRIIPVTHLWTMIFTMWFIKVFIEVCGLPLSVYLANHLKKIEAMDIYDNHTNFNLFSLDARYLKSDNKV